MQQFRDLTDKVFFKVFLGFIALSFIMFGVNSFIMGSPNQWVAKVGDKKITQNQFISSIQRQTVFINREMSDIEAQNYTNSPKFQQDVLNSLINRKMYEIVGDHFAIIPSEDIILNEIVKDKNFHDENNEFDQENFASFLRYNSINEQDYINRLSNDIASQIVINSLTSTTPVNKKLAIEQEEDYRQTRIVDIIQIDETSIPKIGEPSEEEIKAFFDKNRENFIKPEYREISYLSFNKKDLAKNVKITDEDIKNYYQSNLDDFVEAQTRNSLHILFDDEKLANSFLTRFEDEIKNDGNSSPQDIFTKLAKEIVNQDSQSLKLDDISRQGFFPELTKAIFSLEIGSHSPIIKTQIGYHIVLLTKINPSKQKSLDSVKNDIETLLAKQKSEQIIEEKIVAIDDNMLLTNSIKDTAQKFDLSYVEEPITMNKDGLDTKNNAVEITKDFEELVNTAFNLKENQFSQMIYNKKKDLFYIIKIEKIIPQNQKNLDEAKQQIIAEIKSQKITENVANLGKKVAAEIEENPQQFAKIASKYGLTIEKDQELPREFMITLKDDQKVPYKNAFLEEVFKLNINQISKLIDVGSNKYAISLLKKINKKTLESNEYNKIFDDTKKRFQNEILEEFNKYLSINYPVSINSKLTDADFN